jgi:hypothetical protein
MELPERCDAAEIKAVLIAAAQPESRVILDRSVEVGVPCVVTMTTQRLWRITLWRTPDQALSQTLAAWAPDGRDWQLGCQRRWLEGGAVIDPLDELTAEQRDALDARLQRAVCWPQLEETLTMLPLEKLEKVSPAKRHVGRRGRRLQEVA